MVDRVLRAVVFGASVLALWLVALPAFASEPVTTPAQPEEAPLPSTPGSGSARGGAPLCDDRGATVLAPPPIVQEPESTLDVDDSAAIDCLAAAFEKSADEGRSNDKDSSPPTFDATTVLTRATLVVTASEREVIPVPTSALAPPHGVRVRVERPPRG